MQNEPAASAGGAYFYPNELPPQLGLRIVWAYDEGDRGMLKTGQLLGKLLQHPAEYSERG